MLPSARFLRKIVRDPARICPREPHGAGPSPQNALFLPWRGLISGFVPDHILNCIEQCSWIPGVCFHLFPHIHLALDLRRAYFSSLPHTHPSSDSIFGRILRSSLNTPCPPRVGTTRPPATEKFVFSCTLFNNFFSSFALNAPRCP